MVFSAKIKLIIWDLDETLWKGTISDNVSIEIREDFISFINESLDRGIVHSICSKNDFEITKKYMTSVGLWDLFVFPSINWNPKGERIKNTINNMNLRAENVLFIDDNISNLHEATYYCPEIQICTPQEFVDVMESVYQNEVIDKSRPRLSQYRLLEEKFKSKQDYASNEDFLRSCNIRVDFHDDCEKNIDRIHDLIMRSNQLNYTKFRQKKEELYEDLHLPDTKAAYITVHDAFGDYGIVGFYMIVEGKVKHFLFSCRTLGMLVEQYVYVKIGCPSIEVVGDVITQLNDTDLPDWINRSDASSEEKYQKGNINNLKILFKGPCDISQIFSFIEETDAITTDFTYTNDKGINVEGHNHTSQIVTSMKASIDQKEQLVRETPWLDLDMLTYDNWNDNDAIVFSLLTDGNLGVYQHKETGWEIALCESFYDLTDSDTWDDYINQRIYSASITFSEEALVDFSDRYKYIDNSDGELTIHNLETIYQSIESKTKLILILGSEFPFENNERPSYTKRYIFHKILNDKIKKWSADKNNVHLIEISDYITSEKDYTDTINHFHKRVYYRMAQDILAILDQKQQTIKIKSKQYFYYVTLKKRIKETIKKIIGRK